MKKSITKNQHYVPQFLLKNFGWLENKDVWNILIFHKRTSKVYIEQIKQKFSEHYFYDKDNTIENFLDKEIESPASIIINAIVNGKVNIIEEQDNKSLLMAFISSQLQRTPAALEKTNTFLNTFLNEGIKQLLSLNGYDPEEASKGYFKFPEIVSDITLEAVIDSVLLKDLNFHIIKNETQLEYWISDHPVFAYNWLYRDLEHPAVTSITARGFQIFLPLSPSITLCLYDSEVYKYGQRNQIVTHVSNVADIELINSFKIINLESIIGFKTKEDESSIKQLYEKNKTIKIHHYESFVSKGQENEVGEIKIKPLVFARQTKLKKMPSFINIKRKAKNSAASFSHRDPILVAKHIEFQKLLNSRQA